MSFDSLLMLLETSKYFLVFSGCYLEGTVVMMTTGLLVHTGQLSFWPAYTALFLGDTLSDIMWYCIGYFGGEPFMRRFGAYIGATPPVFNKLKEIFHRNHLSILVTSKLTMGFGFAAATLATAGMMRISFTRYVVINVLAGIPWVFAMVGVGYFFGNVLALVPFQFQVGLGIAGLIAAFFGLRAISKNLAGREW